jgi:hypothetical protein
MVGLAPATILSTVELSTGPLGHQVLSRKAADSVDYAFHTIPLEAPPLVTSARRASSAAALWSVDRSGRWTLGRRRWLRLPAQSIYAFNRESSARAEAAYVRLLGSTPLPIRDSNAPPGRISVQFQTNPHALEIGMGRGLWCTSNSTVGSGPVKSQSTYASIADRNASRKWLGACPTHADLIVSHFRYLLCSRTRGSDSSPITLDCPNLGVPRRTAPDAEAPPKVSDRVDPKDIIHTCYPS